MRVTSLISGSDLPDAKALFIRHPAPKVVRTTKPAPGCGQNGGAGMARGTQWTEP